MIITQEQGTLLGMFEPHDYGRSLKPFVTDILLEYLSIYPEHGNSMLNVSFNPPYVAARGDPLGQGFIRVGPPDTDEDKFSSFVELRDYYLEWLPKVI